MNPDIDDPEKMRKLGVRTALKQDFDQTCEQVKRLTAEIEETIKPYRYLGNHDPSTPDKAALDAFTSLAAQWRNACLLAYDLRERLRDAEG